MTDDSSVSIGHTTSIGPAASTRRTFGFNTVQVSGSKRNELDDIADMLSHPIAVVLQLISTTAGFIIFRLYLNVAITHGDNYCNLTLLPRFAKTYAAGGIILCASNSVILGCAYKKWALGIGLFMLPVLAVVAFETGIWFWGLQLLFSSESDRDSCDHVLWDWSYGMALAVLVFAGAIVFGLCCVCLVAVVYAKYYDD